MPKAAASKAVASKAAASARRCRGAAGGQLALAAPPDTRRSGRSGWKSRNAKPRPYKKTGKYSVAWSKEIQAQPLKHLFGAFLAFLESLPVTIHQTRCVQAIGRELAMCKPDLQPKETRWTAKLPQVIGAGLGVDFETTADPVVITCIHAGTLFDAWSSSGNSQGPAIQKGDVIETVDHLGQASGEEIVRHIKGGKASKGKHFRVHFLRTTLVSVEPLVSQKELVEKWQSAVQQPDRPPTLQQLMKAVLARTNKGIKKQRCRLITRPPSQRWSRRSKKGTPAAPKDAAPKAVRVARFPAAPASGRGATPPPLGRGPYPSWARPAAAAVPAPCLRTHPVMRQLRALCASCGAAAVAAALEKFLGESPPRGCSVDSLADKWWFMPEAHSETEHETSAKADRLVALWNDFISRGVIEEFMVPRAALMILRQREVPDALCDTCGRELQGGAPVRPDSWVQCSHRFCSHCLLGRALAPDGRCRLCAGVHAKKLGAAERRGERAFRATVRQYSSVLATVAGLRARVADKSAGAGPTTGTAAEDAERNATQDLIGGDGSDADSEFAEDVFAGAEIVSVSGVMWRAGPEDDTEARQEEAPQHLEEDELSQAEVARRYCEDRLRSLREEHPNISESTAFRAMALIPFRHLIPEDLLPEYLCSCGRRVCICRHKVAALKLQVETLKEEIRGHLAARPPAETREQGEVPRGSRPADEPAEPPAKQARTV